MKTSVVWNWLNTHTCACTSRRCCLLKLFVVDGRWVNPLNAKLNPICHLLALVRAHHILHVRRIKVNYDGIKLAEGYGIARGEGTFLSGTLSTKNPTWTGVASNLKDNREDLEGAVFRRDQICFPEVLKWTWSRCARDTDCHMCPSCSYTLRIVASDRRRRISLVFWYSQSLLQQPEIMWGSFISGRISCFGAACAVCLLVTSRHKVALVHNTKITFTYNTVVSD